MAIVIKGMKKPQSCPECAFDDSCYCTLGGDGMKNCPIICEVGDDFIGTAQSEEFGFLKKFAKEGDFFFEVCKRQLRSLWTAYCIRYDLDVDTLAYDTQLKEVWLSLRIEGEDCWMAADDEGTVGFEEFDDYMCEEMV